MPEIEEMTVVPEYENSLYIADEKAYTTAYDSDDAYSARYRYDTQVKNNPKTNYFGYVEMPHKKGKNYVSSFFKGVGHGLVSAAPTIEREAFRLGTETAGKVVYDFTSAALDGPKEGEDIGNFFGLLEKEDELNEADKRFYDMSNEYFGEMKKEQERWIAQFGLNKDEENNEFIYGLGEGATSLLGALALTFITKNPTAAAVAFGVGQTGSVYEELREKGVASGESMLYAAPAGLAEGVLEKVGLHLLIENLAEKTLLKGVMKSVISEGIQEGTQQGVEEILLAKFRDEEDMKDKVGRVLTAMAYGAILGGVVGTAGRPFANRFAKENADKLHNEYGIDSTKATELARNAAFGNKKERTEAGKEIQKIIGTAEFKKLGFDDKTAENLAEAFVTESDEVRDEILNTAAAEIDPETYEGGSPEAGADFIDAQLKDRDIIAENFDIKETVKQAALEAGYDKDAAEAAATLTEKAAIVLTDITGETPLEQWENGGALEFEKDTLPTIDELTPVDDNIYYDEDFDIDAAERGAIMAEGSIADTPAIAGQVDDDIPFYQGQIAKQDNNVVLSIDTKEETKDMTEEEFKQKMLETLWSFKNNKIYNDSLGADIEIRTSSVKKYKMFFADSNKRLIVPYIPELLKEATFKAEPSYTPKTENNIKNYWKSDVGIKIDNNLFFVHLTVKEDNRGNYFWDAQVKENAQLAESVTNTGAEERYSENSEDAISISKKPNTVKRFYQSGLATNLTEREGGPHIADDSETVEVVKIDENSIPDFKSKRELVSFIKSVLGNERNITIKSTGDSVLVSNGAVNRVASKSRSKLYNEVFPAIRALVENAKYSGFEEADEKHPNVKGQDVYHTALVVGTKPYAVQFKVDIPLENGTHNYAGHKISDIEIASSNSADERFNSPMQKEDAISSVTLAVLRGKVKPAKLNGKTLEQDARGYINISTAGGVIHLLKTADKSTIIHELGHFFVNRYLLALQKAGRTDELKGVLNWLGTDSIDTMTTEHHERFARGFETYVMEGNAPSGVLERLFTRFKNFLIEVYQDLTSGKIINPEEINDDVRDFFDKMLAMDKAEPVSLEKLKGKTAALREVISNAVKGKEVTVDGLGLDDLRDLVKAINARIPRMPKNLTQRIRSAGGINIDFAKSMDIDKLMGQHDKVGGASGLFVKNGGIDSEDTLVEFLQGLGFVQSGYAETYEDTSAQWEQAMNSLENADSLYTLEDEKVIATRDSLIEAAHIAGEAMGDVDFDTLERAVKDLRKNDIAAVNKDTLKYIKEKLKDIDKNYQKLIKDSLRNQKADIKKVQTAITDFIKKQPLTAAGKIKLIGAIKKANSRAAYLKVLADVRDKAKSYYEAEQKKIVREQIEKELKATKPKSIEKQRFDYENNRLFADLRKYDLMTQGEAFAELTKMQNGKKAEDLEEAEETDKIRMRFLAAKHRGAESSFDLLTQVLSDIQKAKEEGRKAKDDEEQTAALNKEAARQELLFKLLSSTADKDKKVTKVMNAYRRGFANLWSMLNSMFGKDIADKYEFETLQTETDANIWRATEECTKAAKRIFGIKKTGALAKLFADMQNEKHIIYDFEGIKTEVNRLQIMDIYNAVKNEKTRQDYYEAFDADVLDGLLLSLTKEERDFADYLMDTANGYYDMLNKVYIKLYATDLPKVENYWPATSEHRETVDILGEYEQQSNIPSSLKERSKGKVVPRPVNALDKFNKHIAEAEYIGHLGLPYMEMKRIFKSRRVKGSIEQHFGENVYKDLMELINSVSLKQRYKFTDAVSGWLNKIINNVVLSKIAIAPSVFVKQLISATNYTERMNAGKWFASFAEGLSHPRETWRYMMDNAPFLKARLAGGYNESVIMALAEKKSDWNNVLSLMTRYGDMTAIVFGGYPYLKSLREAGDADAVKKFEYATLRSQQSGTRSSLSGFQQSTAGWRIFLAFKNTPMQYMRKIVDAFLMKQNGDMTAGEFAKTIFNYAIVQPTLFAMVSFAYIETWRALIEDNDDDDDEKALELMNSVLEQMIVNPIAAVPFLDDIISSSVQAVTGNKPYGMGVLLIDDVDRSLRKLGKEDKDFFDYWTIVSPLIEAAKGLPSGRALRFTEDVVEEK